MTATSEGSPSRLVMATLVLGAVLVLAVGTLRYAAFNRQGKRESLPVLGHVPGFSLVRETGTSYGRSDLLGKVWVADFIFTSCAGPCPLMTTRMAELQQVLASEDGVRFVSFSVDPERDTPQVLSRYAARYGAQAERWAFLTGDRTEIRRLAIEGFKLAVGADPEDENLILHSTKFVLVDRQGAIRGYFDGTDAADMTRLAAEIRRLQIGGVR